VEKVKASSPAGRARLEKFGADLKGGSDAHARRAENSRIWEGERAAPRANAAPIDGKAGASRAPDPGSFDNFIAGALFVAFVIYITAKGELGAYLQLLLYTPPAGSAAAPTTSAAQQTAQNVVNGAAAVATSPNPFSFGFGQGIQAAFGFLGMGSSAPAQSAAPAPATTATGGQ
jgi:hypothetical protein